MRYSFHTVDVFAERPFGGNPLAVFPNAPGLTDVQMQAIAREFNFSETVFVFPAVEARHTRRLRIFTPTAEVPFAGHPTIGTAHVLAACGMVEPSGDQAQILFEEGIGIVPVSVRFRERVPVFAQLTAAMMPEFGPSAPPVPALASVLGLESSQILDNGFFQPQAVSCGLRFLYVPVRDRAALQAARIRREQWEAVLANYWAPQVFVFTPDTGSPDVHVRARMFAPGLGVEEDPATGSAAAALAGYLARREQTAGDMLRWTVEQGVEMGRPSRLEVEAERVGGLLKNVRVGGRSVMMTEGTFDVPD
jgi:trans-2,3-dihydro-3-hydroxyanthranilate isomerase